jgi:hypothetical protein
MPAPIPKEREKVEVAETSYIGVQRETAGQRGPMRLDIHLDYGRRKKCRETAGLVFQNPSLDLQVTEEQRSIFTQLCKSEPRLSANRNRTEMALSSQSLEKIGNPDRATSRQQKIDVARRVRRGARNGAKDERSFNFRQRFDGGRCDCCGLIKLCL